MIIGRLSVLSLLLAASAAMAQSPPAVRPATVRPRHVGKVVPVVQAPPNAHAQHPAGAQGPASAPAAAAATKPPEGKPPEGKPSEGKPPEGKPPEGKPPEGPPKGSVTSLPLPRWAALRSDDVNLRLGPGIRFPIQWQYHRRDLPVQILREVDVWRLIEDQDGVKGWVHRATLVGHRGFVVKGGQAVLRRSARDDAGAVALLKPDVIGRVRSCEASAAWCDMQVGEYRGWLRRDQVWGIDPGEAVGS